ncbi:hypothetical protein MF672_024470 [Actinomadura sp. ATCC 31491]|uniref:Uncharacterized protein n=1 Tax=Actinomadura luzonensis TaxID=2805427 RepID=A0ABT0FX70_9ACTN|nr:hypothetical protein [Actinomadura luzonensis]MCK2216922.1 hypothetical protein [Actinomadura luzonensis]
MVAEPGGQPRLRAAGAGGDHHQAGVQPAGQLAAHVHVGGGAERRGAADRDRAGPPAPRGQLAGALLDGGLHRGVRQRAAVQPADGGAEHAVEQQVAAVVAGGEQQVAAQPGDVGGGGRHPGVVALRSPAGHQVVAAPGEGVGDDHGELAGLVAAAREAGQVVALDPQVAGPEPETPGQAGQRMQRGGGHREDHPPIVSGARRTGKHRRRTAAP